VHWASVAGTGLCYDDWSATSPDPIQRPAVESSSHPGRMTHVAALAGNLVEEFSEPCKLPDAADRPPRQYSDIAWLTCWRTGRKSRRPVKLDRLAAVRRAAPAEKRDLSVLSVSLPPRPSDDLSLRSAPNMLQGGSVGRAVATSELSRAAVSAPICPNVGQRPRCMRSPTCSSPNALRVAPDTNRSAFDDRPQRPGGRQR
jgi:hypothetical protein